MTAFLHQLRWDSAFWRDLARRGASHGPAWFRRWSPGPIGLAFALWPTARRATLRHRLRTILGIRSPAREAFDLARSYASFAHSLADSLALSSGPLDDIVQVQAQGVDLLTSALARGRGVIIGTAHTSGWEVSLAALRHHGDAPIAVVMRRERDDHARHLHGALSSSRELTVIEVGEDPLASLPLLAHLRRGGIVALQMDRCPPGTRHYVGVGQNVSLALPAGPFVLAAVSSAPILMALSRRTSHRHYDIALSTPIELPRRPGEDRVRAATDRVVTTLVQFIQAYPDQWFGFEE